MSVLHEAYLYRDMADFVRAAGLFIEEGTSAGEAVLVAVSAPQIAALREALGPAQDVTFADMAKLGRNPGRIISVWRKFVRGHGVVGRRCRGIGEPVWQSRTAAELIECQRHEVLLNTAFADSPPWRLMCPYNVSTLDQAVIDEALRSHPTIGSDGARTRSDTYLPTLARLTPALPPVPEEAEELAFTTHNLRTLREAVAVHCANAGLNADRTGDMVLATHEIAVNSIRHGGGWGLLRIWCEYGKVTCEVTDKGRIDDPLVGRAAPAPHAKHGRGLWLANELCDLVQLRSSPQGTIVRLHMSGRTS